MSRLNAKLTKNEKSQLKRTFDTGRIYMAEVMDVRNVSRSGDLLVYLIGSELDKSDEHNWVHASYASNFYGTTPYDANSSPSYEKDPQSFGQWFPLPCVGNFVFVFFPVSSAENIMCYWFACPVNPFTNYMLPGIPGKDATNDSLDSHEALCERNDKCSGTSNDKSNNKISVNKNKVDGNTVFGKDLIDDKENFQQLINDNNISKDTVRILIENMDVEKNNDTGYKNNIGTLTKYMSEQGIADYKSSNGKEFSTLLLSLYNSEQINLENLKDYYNQTNSIQSNERDGDTSGSCSNNLGKQKSYFNDIKKSEQEQAKYIPLNVALKEQGLDKDKVRGYSTAGAKRDCPSMCYGIKTPLGNTFVMDDGWTDADNKRTWKWKVLEKDNLDGNGDIKKARQLVDQLDGLSPWQRKPGSKNYERKNAGFRLRTRNGTQILIADEGTVYMINRDGSCWVEMTKNGYLEGYSKKGVAISSDGDINLHTSRNIYMECDETLAVKAKKINIETNAGKGTDKDAIGGDINIAKTAHINTNAVISANKIYANEGKIDKFESMGGKMIGEFAGTFLGYVQADASFFQGKDLKKPDILSVKDDKEKLLIEPKEEEKVDVDGQGTLEDNNKKIKETINTKITTHEPYFGHCKYTPKKSDKEKEEKEKKEQEKKEKEGKEKENQNNTQQAQEKDAKTNCGQTNNNCTGCNTSSGCCGNSNPPTTSCSGCGGVTNQISKDFLNEIPKSNKKFEDIKLSEYFNLSDLIKSSSAKENGINNVPESLDIENNLKDLSVNVLDKLKQKFPNLQINSGYRSSELNSLVGGASKSQHQNGQAADVKVPGMSNYELACWIRDNLDYDQLILEDSSKSNPTSGWVHVSYNSSGNRNQKLTANNGIMQNGLFL